VPDQQRPWRDEPPGSQRRRRPTLLRIPYPAGQPSTPGRSARHHSAACSQPGMLHLRDGTQINTGNGRRPRTPNSLVMTDPPPGAAPSATPGVSTNSAPRREATGTNQEQRAYRQAIRPAPIGPQTGPHDRYTTRELAADQRKRQPPGHFSRCRAITTRWILLAPSQIWVIPALRPTGPVFTSGMLTRGHLISAP
jgi:hypothetical protein